MTEEQKTTLNAVIRTLDTVTVSGAQNMDKMLGCMQVLKTMTEEPAQAEGAGRTQRE